MQMFTFTAHNLSHILSVGLAYASAQGLNNFMLATLKHKMSVFVSAIMTFMTVVSL